MHFSHRKDTFKEVQSVFLTINLLSRCVLLIAFQRCLTVNCHDSPSTFGCFSLTSIPPSGAVILLFYFAVVSLSPTVAGIGTGLLCILMVLMAIAFIRFSGRLVAEMESTRDMVATMTAGAKKDYTAKLPAKVLARSRVMAACFVGQGLVEVAATFEALHGFSGTSSNPTTLAVFNSLFFGVNSLALVALLWTYHDSTSRRIRKSSSAKSRPSFSILRDSKQGSVSTFDKTHASRGPPRNFVGGLGHQNQRQKMSIAPNPKKRSGSSDSVHSVGDDGVVVSTVQGNSNPSAEHLMDVPINLWRTSPGSYDSTTGTGISRGGRKVTDVDAVLVDADRSVSCVDDSLNGFSFRGFSDMDTTPRVLYM